MEITFLAPTTKRGGLVMAPPAHPGKRSDLHLLADPYRALTSTAARIPTCTSQTSFDTYVTKPSTNLRIV